MMTINTMSLIFKMHKAILFVLLGLLLVLSSIPVYANTSDFELHWFSIDTGGTGSSSGGSYTLSGTIGQPDAGLMDGGDFTIQGGFWNSDTASSLLDIFIPVVVK